MFLTLPSMMLFQSTPPVRGATYWCEECCNNGHVSIHAPRAGGDGHGVRHFTRGKSFNPRPPCGGRQVGFNGVAFQVIVSIHAPRAGGDVPVLLDPGVLAEFQSTPPVRGATASFAACSAE